jgi:hypothetical protein
MGFWMNMWTWQLGNGHGYTSDAAQWWFGLQDPPDEWGVAAYHWYSDPALSRDGSKLAKTDGDGDDSQLLIAATHGPAWSGHAPYPEPDYVGGVSSLAAPTLECATGRGKYVNPSWSRDGHTLAYGKADGVYVLSVPSLTCSQMRERLLVRGAVDAAFGPGDVKMSDAPSGRVRVGHVSVRPRSLRAGRSGRVRFTLTRSARVTVMAGGVGVRVRGHRGVNAVRLRFLRGLRPDHYRLTVRTGGSIAGAGFRVNQ